MQEIESICRQNNVLLVFDEIQTGLGRTGKMFAFEHEGVKPDGITIGKALSGGFYPISAFISTHEVMDVFNPGDHGSTFGGKIPLFIIPKRVQARSLFYVRVQYLIPVNKKFIVKIA